ncbi:MAG: hypothetical protein ACREP9_02130, partial [Candidatus Dormibacteraceae bacterium]
IAPVPDKYLDTARKIIGKGTWARFAAQYREMTSRDCGSWVPRPNSESDVERLGRMIGEYLDEKVMRDMLEDLG